MLRLYSSMPIRAVFFHLLLLTVAAPIGWPAANPDPIYHSLREAAVAESLVVENVVIRKDAGTLTLKSGVIGFTSPVLDRETVAIFQGQGEFTFTPVLPIEKNYLKSVTGQDSVQESFDRALFCFTDQTAKEIRQEARTRAAATGLADLLRDFRKHLRSRNENPRSLLEDILTSENMDNVEADILADLYNPKQPGFFSAWLHGRKHSDLRFHVKPRGVIPALPSPEEVAIINFDPEGTQEGIWYLSHLRSELEARNASSDEDKRSAQAESYRIETSIGKNDHFTASTELRFRTVIAGDRVLKFGLLPTLRVTRVSMGSEDVPFIQEDRKEDAGFYVVLPRPMEEGSVQQLRIEYQGDKVVHKEGGGNFSVGARESWYPALNSFHDHAAYDLTFRIPKHYVLVSVGKLAKEWSEQDQACSHWISEVPIPVAGFNYGTFKRKVIEDPTTGVTIEGYANSDIPDYLKGLPGSESMAPSALMERTMVDAQNAMRLFTVAFGKSEFPRIAITQQPEFNFGQSWPTLVYLPMSAYLDSTQRWTLMGIQNGLSEFVEEVTPHEVSHQWWGHMVGWSSYHDQWLSEGFADFSAGMFLQLTEKSPDKYVKYWDHARQRLVEKNQFGRRNIDAGPLWMGLRLGAFRSPGAYSSVVYGKGGYILHMLRSMMFDSKEGDRYFADMMKDFVQQYMNRNASTESFQKVAEKHMRPGMNLAGDGTLNWFFQEWVYGTMVPRYKFDQTVTAADQGKWLLKGTLTQSEVTEGFRMLVPLYVDFDGQLMRLGTVRIAGNTSVPIEILLPKKPRRVLINAYHDVLEQ